MGIETAVGFAVGMAAFEAGVVGTIGAGLVVGNVVAACIGIAGSIALSYGIGQLTPLLAPKPIPARARMLA